MLWFKAIESISAAFSSLNHILYTNSYNIERYLPSYSGLDLDMWYNKHKSIIEIELPFVLQHRQQAQTSLLKRPYPMHSYKKGHLNQHTLTRCLYPFLLYFLPRCDTSIMS